MAVEKEIELKAVKDLIRLLDETLASEGWQETFLLRSIEKKIKALRDEAEQLQTQYSEETLAKSLGASRGASMSSYQTVYISVFQQEFTDLRKWERTLKSITDYSITRPVYKDEIHVQELIRGRPDPNKEGYVEVMVRNEDVVKGFAGKPTADKAGYELVNIKEGGVKPAGIKRFVLGSRRYEFVDGKLILIT